MLSRYSVKPVFARGKLFHAMKRNVANAPNGASQEGAVAMAPKLPNLDCRYYLGGAAVAIAGGMAWLKQDIENVRSDVKDLRVEVADVRKEVADLRTELRTENEKLRSEMRTENEKLRSEMHQGFSELKVLFFQNKAEEVATKPKSSHSWW